jgi:urea carboxylase-associated protein 1
MAGIVLRGKKVSDAERAAYVKKMAAKHRATAVKKMDAAAKKTGKKKVAAALAIPGKVISDETNEPGANHYVRKLSKGSRLRIIDLGGQQAVDFLCFDQANPEIRYNAANAIKLNETLYVTTGFKLYSDTAEVLMTLTADTVGKHDTIGGACSNQVNYLRYGIKNTCSCRDNFISALKTVGLGQRDIHANINFFMHVPVAKSGRTGIREGLSRPGDFVELRADKDVIVVISNCPQFYNPCSGWNPTPIRLIEWRPE